MHHSASAPCHVVLGLRLKVSSRLVVLQAMPTELANNNVKTTYCFCDGHVCAQYIRTRTRLIRLLCTCDSRAHQLIAACVSPFVG